MGGRTAKSRRHGAILRLLRERRIASQGDLVEALAGEGHRVTQSTLSRDLRDLRVIRLATEAGSRYLPPSDGPAEGAARGMRSIAAREVLQVSANENLVVIRTQVGRAPGVAAFLDSRRPREVLATVAGDDTILVVPTRVARTRELERAMRELFRRGSAPSDRA